MCRLLFIFALYGTAALPLALNYSRPVRPWEFFDAVGQQASLLGQEDGTLEAYVYPLKLFTELQFSFEVAGKVIPASAISRRVSFHTGSSAIIYTGDEFQVTETAIVPVHEPGGLIRLDIVAHDPVAIRFSLRRDFQLMWPASIGSAFGQWKTESKLFVFGADGQPYSAVLGSPDLTATSIDYATNYSRQEKVEFSLGTVAGTGTRTVAFAGSMKSFEEAEKVERNLIENALAIQTQTENHYRAYLDQTASVELPDKDLQQAYDWSRLSLVKGMVDNPFLGLGLVAGYGPSKGGYRPGFAWFFGRDSFWSSFALDSAGDWKASRHAIEFISRFQRDDGKIPHEISQSAQQVAWSKDYPYEYASADATPLFIIAIRDYVQHSGDKVFASTIWERARKAMAFSRSTFDTDGFPKNFGVGHGWVEGGPLLPVREEFYLAGCYVEAVRSLAQLARWTGHNAEVQALENEFTEKHHKLDQLFWLDRSGTYAFAIANDGKPVDQPTVLTLVPEWWGLLPLERVQRMTEQLGDESHAADWGMRIISSKAPLYSPAGYHFGSVWPLFTGWAALGEYHAHATVPAFANLKANSRLALDGGGRNTTEVLSGETYSPLSTASPHQIWSAAMVISPLLRGLFGLDIDSIEKRVTLHPHLPPDWNTAALRHVVLGTGYVDFEIHRDDSQLTLQVSNHGAGDFTLSFAPAYSPYTAVSAATVDGKPARFTREMNAIDWHPAIETGVGERPTTITLQHEKWFGVSIPDNAPRLAETSSNLKLLSQKWENANKRLLLTFSGLAGHHYAFAVSGAENVTQAAGAARDGNLFQLTIPNGTGYQHTQVRIDLK
jgi:glycogen debranching enzyme